jgi:hypothetical protein
MRIERHGGPPDLQAAFTKCVLTELKGRVLDDDRNVEAALGRFPDFTCFRDLVLIEMKHLQTNQSDRINEVFDKTVDPADKPIFYGTRDGQHIINQANNGDQVKAALVSKLSRTVETHLSKANSQFADYRSRLREFTPDLVLHAVQGKMRGLSGDTPRFADIDGVLYISEKHYAVQPDGRIAFPVGIFEAASATAHPWKVNLIEVVAEAWSHSRARGSVIPGGSDVSFDVIDDIPRMMPLHERWQLEYKRRPYMSAVSDEQLKVIFNRCVAVASLTFVKGSWVKPANEDTAVQMRLFTHIIEETNRRGLDLRKVNPAILSPAEQEQVYRGLPQELIDLLLPNPPTPGRAAETE